MEEQGINLPCFILMIRNVIAFSGTHGTGKSSTAYKFGAQLKVNGYNIAVIDELARECPLKINKDASALTQFWIIAAQMKREIKMMDKYDFIISDRSIMDNLAYATVLGLFDDTDMGTVIKYTKIMYRNIFVLSPIGFNYQVADGVRDMDVAFRMDVHRALVYLYDNFNIDYHIIKDEKDLELTLNTMFNLRNI